MYGEGSGAGCNQQTFSHSTGVGCIEDAGVTA